MAETTIKKGGKQEHLLESKFCKVLGTQNLEAWLQCLSLLLMTEKNFLGRQNCSKLLVQTTKQVEKCPNSKKQWCGTVIYRIAEDNLSEVANKIFPSGNCYIFIELIHLNSSSSKMYFGFRKCSKQQGGKIAWNVSSQRPKFTIYVNKYNFTNVNKIAHLCQQLIVCRVNKTEPNNISHQYLN